MRKTAWYVFIYIIYIYHAVKQKYYKIRQKLNPCKSKLYRHLIVTAKMYGIEEQERKEKKAS